MMKLNPQFTFDEQFQALQLQVDLPIGALERLYDAVEARKLPRTYIWDCDPGAWFCTDLSSDVAFAVTREHGCDRLRISQNYHHADSDDDRFDGTAPVRGEEAPEWMWPEFLAPLRLLLKNAGVVHA